MEPAFSRREVRIGSYIAIGLWLMIVGVLATLLLWSAGTILAG